MLSQRTNKSLCFQHTTVIETGLSDFHKLTVTMMRSNYQKQQPNILNYRNYKFFNNENFRNDLLYEIQLIQFQNIECEQFEHLFMDILDKHAPLKTRLVRANNSPFMTKDLYKAIIMKSRLRNKFLRLKTTE